MQFSQATVSAVGRARPASLTSSSRSVVHSFQLRAYEQGTRSRLIEAENELRSLRHERDNALRDLNACKDQTRTWAAEVDRRKAEARSMSYVHVSLGSYFHIPHPSSSRDARFDVYYYCSRIERYLW